MKGTEGVPSTTTQVEATEKSHAEKELDLIKVGDSIKVLRSSGEQEEDWKVEGFNRETGNTIVRKSEGNKVLEKEIPQIELYAMNKPEEETRKFSLNEWVNLWNSTEVTVNRIISTKEDAKMMLTPHEARQLLRERGKVDMLRTALNKSDAAAIKALQRRIAFFGEVDSERALLRFYKDPKSVQVQKP